MTSVVVRDLKLSLGVMKWFTKGRSNRCDREERKDERLRQKRKE